MQQVVSNPVTVWGIGPFFAAVTGVVHLDHGPARLSLHQPTHICNTCRSAQAGVAFKEGMCYGKPEAGALFFVTPLLLLGHLTG